MHTHYVDATYVFEAAYAVLKGLGLKSLYFFSSGLSWSTDENALRDAFSSYGDISEAKVILDRETGRSKGFGFISFVSTEDAESAKKGMDGNDINGKTVRVDFAIEKPRPFGGFGGGGSYGGNMGYGGQSGDSSFGDSYSRPNSSFSSHGSQDPFGSKASDSFDNKDDFGGDSFGKESFGSQFVGKDSLTNKSSDEDSFGNDSFDVYSPGDSIGGKDKY